MVDCIASVYSRIWICILFFLYGTKAYLLRDEIQSQTHRQIPIFAVAWKRRSRMQKEPSRPINSVAHQLRNLLAGLRQLERPSIARHPYSAMRGMLLSPCARTYRYSEWREAFDLGNLLAHVRYSAIKTKPTERYKKKELSSAIRRKGYGQAVSFSWLSPSTAGCEARCKQSGR